MRSFQSRKDLLQGREKHYSAEAAVNEVHETDIAQ